MRSFTADWQYLSFGSFTTMTDFLAESTSDPSMEFLNYWQAVATSVLLLMAEFLAESTSVP
jgi:hypothetical protein